MKIKFCAVNNFGSYREFNNDFSDQGLTLLHGKTGSGKSTIPDMVFWILFGDTAKGGSVDDIRNWQTEEATIGTLEVEIHEGSFLITRVRGKASENDLYWVKNGGDEPVRGKDLKDTQSLLEARLGVSPLLYEVGAYFHEFSPINNFFLAKAKERRAIFEQIADLSVPKKLAEGSAERKRQVKVKIAEAQTLVSIAESQVTKLMAQYTRTVSFHTKWEEDRARLIKVLESKSATFEMDKSMKVAGLARKSQEFDTAKAAQLAMYKAEFDSLQALVKPPEEVEDAILKVKYKIKELDYEKCKECGGPVDSPLREKYLTQISSIEKAGRINERNCDKFEVIKKNLHEWSNRENPWASQLESAQNTVNTIQEQIETEKLNPNPYTSQINEFIRDFEETRAHHANMSKILADHSAEFALASKLYELSFDLQGLMLQTTVKQAQDRTNQYLETHFDGELRVTFTLEGADSLQVELYKSGYNCGYKQLSKGQRGLLKLCFSVSIMLAASDQAGVHFETLFFDEALDGCDSDFKLKAFDLFQELAKSHTSVYVVEHAPEFQNLFTSQLHIKMEEDTSSVQVDDGTLIGTSPYESPNDKERIELT